MRINVYGEELTDEVLLVTKSVTDDEFGERTFYGLRLFLASPDVLHHSADDDDRSAITVWVPWTHAGGHDFERVLDAIGQLYVLAGHAQHDAATVEPVEQAAPAEAATCAECGGPLMPHSVAGQETPVVWCPQCQKTTPAEAS